MQGLGQGAAAGAVRGVGAVRAALCSPHFSSPVAAADDVWLGARVTAVPRTARRARPPPRASPGVPARRTSSFPSLHPTPSRPPSPLLTSQPRTGGGRAAGGGLGVTAAARGGEKAGGQLPPRERSCGERGRARIACSRASAGPALLGQGQLGPGKPGLPCRGRQAAGRRKLCAP